MLSFQDRLARASVSWFLLLVLASFLALPAPVPLEPPQPGNPSALRGFPAAVQDPAWREPSSDSYRILAGAGEIFSQVAFGSRPAAGFQPLASRDFSYRGNPAGNTLRERSPPGSAPPEPARAPAAPLILLLIRNLPGGSMNSESIVVSSLLALALFSILYLSWRSKSGR